MYNYLRMSLCHWQTVKFDWDSMLPESPWSGQGRAKVQGQSPGELHLWLKRQLKGCPSRELGWTDLTGSFEAIEATCLELPTSKRTAAEADDRPDKKLWHHLRKPRGQDDAGPTLCATFPQQKEVAIPQNNHEEIQTVHQAKLCFQAEKRKAARARNVPGLSKGS